MFADILYRSSYGFSGGFTSVPVFGYSLLVVGVPVNFPVKKQALMLIRWPPKSLAPIILHCFWYSEKTRLSEMAIGGQSLSHAKVAHNNKTTGVHQRPFLVKTVLKQRPRFVV